MRKKATAIILVCSLAIVIYTISSAFQSDILDYSEPTATLATDTDSATTTSQAGEENEDEDSDTYSETETEYSCYYVDESSEDESSEEEIGCTISNFPIVYQMPELPTGCEVTALTMMLNFYGFDVDKVTMATVYLPTASANLHYGSDGLLYGSDLNEYFIGDPTLSSGYVCGTGAIVTAADSYLSAVGSTMRAVDRTGSSPEDLYELIDEGIPVLVWVTIYMADRNSTKGWYTDSGTYVEWSTNDHGAVLIGYTETTVVIADPISGLVEYDKDQFESVFASRGYMCVTLE